MRIAIDLQGAQSSGSRNRGIGRYAVSLSKAIVANRGPHEVIIVLSALFPESVVELRREFEPLVSAHNVVVWFGPDRVHYLDPETAGRREVAETVRNAFFESLDPDVIYVTSLFEGLADDAVSTVGTGPSRIPTVVTLFDLIPLINRDPYLLNGTVEEWYEGKIDHLRRADALMAISESSRQEAIDWLGFPAELVANVGTAADPQFASPDVTDALRDRVMAGHKLNKPFVMYTGGVDYRKNLDGLIRAFSLLAPEIRKAHQLAIVCSMGADERRRLNELCRSLALSSDEIILTGFVPEEELIALYASCKLFVFPSFHEGFGLPALEAMSCGAAVVASNCSSLPEVIGNPGALFDPRNDHAIAQIIEKFLTDESARRRLIEHGASQAQKFSWDHCARRALVTFEKVHALEVQRRLTQKPQGHRPRLAYVSPLPPLKTGIADYSIVLLKELTRFFDIDVVVSQDNVSSAWVRANCSIRSVEWFYENEGRFERVVYHMGNSQYHAHMFEMIERVPGVVVMHDFYLGHIVAHMNWGGTDPQFQADQVFSSHGYAALEDLASARTAQTAQAQDDISWKYPANRGALENSLGVIVHSKYSVDLARQWYGQRAADSWRIVPMPRDPVHGFGRATARARLGVGEEDILVCTFGMVGPTKLSDRLVKAWQSSQLHLDARCILVFVGEVGGGEYGAAFTRAVAEGPFDGRVRIAGWASEELYRDYLVACDIGVQLRANSRGETSAAVLDCLSYGVPTIVNANGSSGYLPDDTIYRLDDDFQDSGLAEALRTLRADRRLRSDLGARAAAYMRAEHSPRRAGQLMFEAIEASYRESQVHPSRMAKSLGGLIAPMPDHELIRIAEAAAKNWHARPQQTLFVDVSILAQVDAKSGIQRVVRSILLELLKNPPQGCRVEPVCGRQGEMGFRYARKFALRFLGISEALDTGDGDEELVVVRQGDIFLGLDLNHFALSAAKFFEEMRLVGAKIYFVIYDLLPVQLPHCFPEGIPEMHAGWLEQVATSDGVICISRAVADEFAAWLKGSGVKRTAALRVGWFHLGADLSRSAPTSGVPEDGADTLRAMASKPTFLMVGTIEPRKGYLQVVRGFESLWAAGADINLVIVGKKGWRADQDISAIRSSPEFRRRLYWMENASDEYLSKIYEKSDCLIAASQGEGFGLPLIEAAHAGIPVIARDIPVFREVAQPGTVFFVGPEPRDLAGAVSNWLENGSRQPRVTTGKISKTWSESAADLMDAVLRDNWYTEIAA